MFKKLRNKFILTNLLTTTVVLVLAFGIIYGIVASSMDRPRMPERNFNNAYSQDVNNFIDEQIHEDRKDSLNTLLISLIITGACVEVAVLFISLLIANQAIKPVKETYLAQKEFIANASHEIKTPLAVIQANLEAADIKNNQWIDNVSQKVEDLAALNDQLLTLARLESRTDHKTTEKTELKPFLESLVAPLAPQIAKKQIKVKLTAKDLKHPQATLNAAALKQILNILLDNAIKYCDKKIEITLDEHQVTIKNDGATISEEQLAHIFERFYQTDKTKSGVGLGLAIANQLAADNKWKLVAESGKNFTAFKLIYR